MCMKSQDYYWNEQRAEYKYTAAMLGRISNGVMQRYFTLNFILVCIELESEGRWSDLAPEWEPRLATALAVH